MKKFKEFLCFIVPLFLLFILYGTLLDAQINCSTLAGEGQYFTPFWQKESFWAAAGNDGRIAWPALFAAAVLALLRYLVRKKIRISALAYYLVSASAGSIAAFANVVFVNWKFYRNICMFPVPTSELVWRSIRADDILLCLLAGVLAAFVLWVGAFLFSWLKKIFRKSVFNVSNKKNKK